VLEQALLGAFEQAVADAETFALPEATHLLHVQNPRGMAQGLAAFFARHPLTTSM
jgi:hypothetical protein